MTIGSTQLLPYDGNLAALAQRAIEAAPVVPPQATGLPTGNDGRPAQQRPTRDAASATPTGTRPAHAPALHSPQYATQRLAQEHGSGHRPPATPHRRGVAAYPSVASLVQILAPSGLVPLSDRPGQALDLYA